MSELIVVTPLKAQRLASGAFILTRKFLDGMAQYAARWPGPVTAMVALRDAPVKHLDPVEVMPGQGPVGVELIPAEDAAMKARVAQAGLVLAGLTAGEVGLASLCRGLGVPLVYIAELDLPTRLQIIQEDAPDLLRRMKRKMSQTLLEPRLRRAVAEAAGLQCNGTPTMDAYEGLNPRTMLFFDSRVREADIITLGELEQRAASVVAGGPLRLAFTGRLVAIKGVLHLPDVALELVHRGVPFTMDICGGGDQEAALAARTRELGLDGHVRLRGVMDFETELVPFMKTQVDLFVCCHTQGDPSCTYLETMSCGVPIAGFDNSALAGLVLRSPGTGWVAPMGDVKALASIIEKLHHNRPSLARAAQAACGFAGSHSFEATMQRRTDHLLECSKASNGAKASSTV